MDTEVRQLDRATRLDDDALRRAAELLLAGGLVAFPTETVYGIAACTRSNRGLERLRQVKSRPPEQPFAVMVPSAKAAGRFVPSAGPLARRLMRKAWPGPLTIVVEVAHPLDCPAAEAFGPEAVAPLFHADNTVGLRCPADSIALALLEKVDGPVVAASANRSGQSPARNADDVVGGLAGSVDLVLDGGPAQYGVASTVVRVIGWRQGGAGRGGPGYQILRAGLLHERTIDKMAVETWLFVCTGNTCRSPMAAAIARARLARMIGCKEQDVPKAGYRVISAGVLAAADAPASRLAVHAAADRGGHLGDHRARRLTVDAVRQADRIFVMTDGHRAAVLSLVPSAEDKTRLLSPGRSIEDPIGGEADVYCRVADQIEQAVERLVEEERDENLSGQ